MKSKIVTVYIPVGLLLLILTIALCSWIGNTYDLPLQNLCNSDGIRWLLCNVVLVFMTGPVCQILILSMGVGIAHHTRLFASIRSAFTPGMWLSVKQRYALGVTLFVMFLYVLGIAIGVFGQEAVLLNITGRISHSPLTEGSIFLLSLGFAIAGVVYGYNAGNISQDKNLVEGISVFTARLLPGIVCLFLSSLSLALADYTEISNMLRIGEGSLWRHVVELLLYYPPLILSLCVHRKK